MRGKRNASENITAEPTPIIVPQPGESGNPTGKGRGIHHSNFITDTLTSRCWLRRRLIAQLVLLDPCASCSEQSLPGREPWLKN